MVRRTRLLAALVSVVFTVVVLPAISAVAAPTWQPVTDLTPSGQNAEEPQVAVDAAGNATAVWYRHNGTAYVVQAATRPAGGAWSAPTNLSADGRDAVEPQVAVDAAGNATAVWRRSNGTGTIYIVQAATRPVGGAWSAPTDLSADGRDAVEPQVAVDAAGNATAVWRRSNGTNDIVQAATRPVGGAWSAPTDLSADGRNADEPQVAVDRAGNATAVWSRSNGTNNIVQAATRPTGGAWSTPTNLSADGRSALEPQVAVDAAGNTTAVWRQSNGTNLIVQAATRPAGGAWSAPTDLSADGRDAREPQVAVDAAGNATAVWYRFNGTNNIVQAATRPAGGAWSTPTNLSADGRNAGEPQVAVGPGGNATAVWLRSNGAHLIVQAATRPAGGAWSAPTNLSADGRNAYEPQVAVDPAGNATTVWSQVDDTTTRISARGLDAAGPVVSSLAIPSKGIVGQPLSFTVTATDVWSTLATTSWAFGDNTTATGTATGTALNHTYRTPGTYQVTLTLTDTAGNTTTKTAPITITATPGTGASITAFTIKPAKIRATGPHAHAPTTAKAKARATVVLTAAAKVTLAFIKKGTKKPSATLVKKLSAGKNTIKLTAKVGKKNLKPGKYLVTATTGTSKKNATLTIVR